MRCLASLHDRVDRQVFEVVTRHIVQYRLGGRRNDHAEIERVAFKFRLDRECLDLRGRIPRDEYLLRRLQNVGVFRGKVTASGLTDGRMYQNKSQAKAETPKRNSHKLDPLRTLNPKRHVAYVLDDTDADSDCQEFFC